VLATGERFEDAKGLLVELVPDPEAERLLAAIRVSEWSELPPVTPLNEARRAAAEGRWEEALTGMLEVVRDDPDARQSMLDVFAVLGDDDPMVREYRQKLATALF